MHGWSFNEDDAECQTLQLSNKDDYISSITLNYGVEPQSSLRYVNIHTNSGESIRAGRPKNDLRTETLTFNEKYSLIGLKSVSSSGATGLGAMDGIGAILFDTGCDVLNPTGPRLVSNSEGDTESDSGNTVLIVIIVVDVLIAIAVIAYIIYKICKRRKAQKVDPAKEFVSQVVVS